MWGVHLGLASTRCPSVAENRGSCRPTGGPPPPPPPSSTSEEAQVGLGVESSGVHGAQRSLGLQTDRATSDFPFGSPFLPCLPRFPPKDLWQTFPASPRTGVFPSGTPWAAASKGRTRLARPLPACTVPRLPWSLRPADWPGPRARDVLANRK